MLRLGVDLIEIGRIEQAVARYGERFLQRVYTAREIEFYSHKASVLAVRFAGKEAVMKLLGTGVRGVGWKEIEILHLDSGKPVVHLHGRAAEKAREMGITSIEVSLSHSRENALAAAIG
ncbi:MAG: holo-ACP synthase [Chloroflexi bacterium]|nr:holo-ACP synthase [Chloroflexota bacterium]